MSSFRYSSDANADIEEIILYIFDLNPVADHPQPCLMHQRRGLQRLAGRLLAHPRRRELAQFTINEWQQFF